jgi:hypothetical protein
MFIIASLILVCNGESLLRNVYDTRKALYGIEAYRSRAEQYSNPSYNGERGEQRRLADYYAIMISIDKFNRLYHSHIAQLARFSGTSR